MRNPLDNEEQVSWLEMKAIQKYMKFFYSQIRNPNIEIRNNFKIRIFQILNFLFWSFRFRKFVLISDFVLRISNFCKSAVLGLRM